MTRLEMALREAASPASPIGDPPRICAETTPRRFRTERRLPSSRSRLSRFPNRRSALNLCGDNPSPIQDGAQIAVPAKPALPLPQSAIRPESVRRQSLADSGRSADYRPREAGSPASPICDPPRICAETIPRRFRAERRLQSSRSRLSRPPNRRSAPNLCGDNPSPIQGGAQIAVLAEPPLPLPQSVIRPESVRKQPLADSGRSADCSPRGAVKFRAPAGNGRTPGPDRE